MCSGPLINAHGTKEDEQHLSDALSEVAAGTDAAQAALMPKGLFLLCIALSTSFGVGRGRSPSSRVHRNVYTCILRSRRLGNPCSICWAPQMME